MSWNIACIALNSFLGGVQEITLLTCLFVLYTENTMMMIIMLNMLGLRESLDLDVCIA